MDALMQRSIKLVESKKKTSVPWNFDERHDQPFFIYDGLSWQFGELSDKSAESSIKQLALYSWNIDFMLPFPDSRIRGAVDHLHTLIAKQSSETATAVFFAECVESDLKLIASHPWIQSTFVITDMDGSSWQSGHYGTTTLIDKRLSVANCFRVHFSQSRMERDGLFVDIKLGSEKAKPLRLCNTHLESLALEPPYRPPQMRMCAQYMHDPAVLGAVLAGDLNAIQDFDKHLHSDSDLKDAYLEMGGLEDDAENGHTWGQQAATAQRERFGTSRMDKVFFCGGVRCKEFERFGAGITVEDQVEKEEISGLGFDKPWITDHLGVKAIFEIEAGTDRKT